MHESALKEVRFREKELNAPLKSVINIRMILPQDYT